MARKKDVSAVVAQLGFDLRAVERLRLGLLADGAGAPDALVMRADAIIADYESRIRKTGGQKSSAKTG